MLNTIQSCRLLEHACKLENGIQVGTEFNSISGNTVYMLTDEPNNSHDGTGPPLHSP